MAACFYKSRRIISSHKKWQTEAASSSSREEGTGSSKEGIRPWARAPELVVVLAVDWALTPELEEDSSTEWAALVVARALTPELGVDKVEDSSSSRGVTEKTTRTSSAPETWAALGEGPAEAAAVERCLQQGILPKLPLI